jgi:hypothetical protein
VLSTVLACAASSSIPLSGPPASEDADTAADTAAGDDSNPGDDPDPRFGTGADGALAIDRRTGLADVTSGDRDLPDAMAYRVQAIQGTRLTFVDPPEAFAVGDEILVIDLRGTSAMPDGVGAYVFTTILDASDEIAVSQSLTNVFADPSQHVIIAQRVPQYTDVDITERGTLDTRGWDGSFGGIVAFRASGTVTIDGRLDADGLGYRGGGTGNESNFDGYQGESWAGMGHGGHGGDDNYNENSGEWAPNRGGGGCHVTGGGGEHGGGATPGRAWYDGRTAPEAGEPYGDANLDRLYFGSGGGGVWNDASGNEGPGGNGGGMVFIAAARLDAGREGAVSARGRGTESWSSGAYTYGAGGGAGGSAWIVAGELDLADGAIQASGGDGMADVEKPGGDGGDGRVRIECGTFRGVECGEADLAGVSVPGVGSVEGL